jgi:hypothetical protein
MAENDIPVKVYNKHLYELRLQDMEERNKMKEELVAAINGVGTDVAVIQNEINNHNKKLDTIESDLKKRDNYGYIGSIIAGIMAGFGLIDR